MVYADEDDTSLARVEIPPGVDNVALDNLVSTSESDDAEFGQEEWAACQNAQTSLGENI